MARKAAAVVDEKAEKPPEQEPILTEAVEVDVGEQPDDKLPSEPVTVEAAPAPPPEPPSEPTPAPTVEDAEKTALRQRLAEMEQAEQLSRQQIETEQRARVEAQRKEWQSQRQAWDAQYDSVVNTIGAAQSLLASAKTELKTAGTEGDWDRIAELQETIGRTSSELRDAENRKTYMDNQLEAWKKRQQQPRQQQPQQPRQQQPQQQPQTAEQYIANLQLPDRVKTWLRAHTEYVTNPTKANEMVALHSVVTRQLGSQDFNDAYFDRMEDLLGLKTTPQTGNGAHRPATTQRQSAPVSAPPTREAPSMVTGRATQSSTRVTLTPEQREVAAQIARSRGIPQHEAEKEYAQNLLKMERMKKNGSIS